MPIPIEILKIKDSIREGCHILCRIHINDKEFRMLIDTGASHTVFDISKANLLSDNDLIDNKQTVRTIGNSDVEGKYLIIDKMRIGDIILKEYKITVIDLSNFNMTYKREGLPLIDGILGGDILVKYNGIIDYSKREMILV